MHDWNWSGEAYSGTRRNASTTLEQTLRRPREGPCTRGAGAAGRGIVPRPWQRRPDLLALAAGRCDRSWCRAPARLRRCPCAGTPLPSGVHCVAVPQALRWCAVGTRCPLHHAPMGAAVPRPVVASLPAARWPSLGLSCPLGEWFGESERT